MPSSANVFHGDTVLAPLSLLHALRTGIEGMDYIPVFFSA
jgi:hypothetical protein